MIMFTAFCNNKPDLKPGERGRERESRETPLREPFTLWIVKVSSRELGLIPDKGRETFSSRLFH
jgi:hypothetical protein